MSKLFDELFHQATVRDCRQMHVLHRLLKELGGEANPAVLTAVADETVEATATFLQNIMDYGKSRNMIDRSAVRYMCPRCRREDCGGAVPVMSLSEMSEFGGALAALAKALTNELSGHNPGADEEAEGDDDDINES